MTNYAHAAITPAGAVISNNVTLTYAPSNDSISTQTVISNTASFTVIELIDVRVQWQDAVPVSVNSPDTFDALTFLVTNTGNGVETFTLARNNAVAGDNYDPTPSTIPIYVESNGTLGLQTGVGGDMPYVAGITLNAEQSTVVYVVSDTVAALALNNTGIVSLAATSTSAGAAGATPGTTLAGVGDGGIDATVGLSQAQSAATGSYIFSGLAVNIVKTVSVVGGGDAAAGKTLLYTITTTVLGNGTVNNLIITDPLTANLNYVANSIKVGGTTRTDAADADNTQFSSNTVTVDFGNTAGPATRIITFNAIIN